MNWFSRYFGSRKKKRVARWWLEKAVTTYNLDQLSEISTLYKARDRLTLLVNYSLSMRDAAEYNKVYDHEVLPIFNEIDQQMRHIHGAMKSMQQLRDKTS